MFKKKLLAAFHAKLTSIDVYIYCGTVLHDEINGKVNFIEPW